MTRLHTGSAQLADSGVLPEPADVVGHLGVNARVAGEGARLQAPRHNSHLLAIHQQGTATVALENTQTIIKYSRKCQSNYSHRALSLSSLFDSRADICLMHLVDVERATDIVRDRD